MIIHSFFFFNDTATTEIYTLSLHDALPIWRITAVPCDAIRRRGNVFSNAMKPATSAIHAMLMMPNANSAAMSAQQRSEEHTSELQSPCNLVCRLLLEKKKTHIPTTTTASRS